MKNHREIAEEIIKRHVHGASNGNGFRLMRDGREIAWCAGALYDKNRPGEPLGELTDFIEMVLRQATTNVLAGLAAEAREQTERCVRLRKEADEADRKAAELGQAIDLIGASLKGK